MSLAPDRLDDWFAPDRQRSLVALLVQRLGLTRRRAECWVRLRAYLWLKAVLPGDPPLRPPLGNLGLPSGTVACSHREAAALFYPDGGGSDRAAGLMLDKLASLGLIRKHFDGNITQIEILPLPELDGLGADGPAVDCRLDDFDPRCDAVAVGLLLAENYHWLSRSSTATPHRIARILRHWATGGEIAPPGLRPCPLGLRVLRRSDDRRPVGFYALFPVAAESEHKFFQAPRRGLHLSVADQPIEADPFVAARPGDATCTAVFIRSWSIAPPWIDRHGRELLVDLQQRLSQLREWFPNLCDLYTLIIHPSYEAMARSLGFSKTIADSQLSVYWMYAPLDYFLSLDLAQAKIELPGLVALD